MSTPKLTGIIPVARSPDGVLRVLLHRKPGDNHMYDFGGPKPSESTSFTDSVIPHFVTRTYGLFSAPDVSPELWLYRRIAACSSLDVHLDVHLNYGFLVLPVPWVDAAALNEAGERRFFWLTAEEFAVAPVAPHLQVASLQHRVVGEGLATFEAHVG
jgi:hypothetical protein